MSSIVEELCLFFNTISGNGIHPAVSGFNHGDSIDLGDVAFGSGTGTTLSYSANDAGTGMWGQI